jgi:DNA-3-methyladenine glycosylase II
MAKLSHIRTESDLDNGIAALIAAEPRFSALIVTAGRPPLRRRPDGFAGLATTIVSQQLSTASAGAIWGRLAAAFDPFEPAAIMRARAPRLAKAGLSSPKIKALKEIARAITQGKLPLTTLADLPADEAHATLTAIHGIGPWTADIYLLSCLGHADAWPAGDLALQEAARLAFGLRTRPTAKEMVTLAEPWRPWRSVAARVLWTYYRSVKGREGAPVQPAKPVKAKRGQNGR